MSKFHLTPKGQARQCSAKTPESCKYSQEAGETVAHYETKEEAQQAYEKQGKEEHGTTNTLTKKRTKQKAQSREEKLAAEYFDKNQRQFLQGFDEEAIQNLKANYINDVMNNEKALSMIKEQESERKIIGDYFDRGASEHWENMDQAELQNKKEAFINDVLKDEESKKFILSEKGNQKQQDSSIPQYKENGDTAYKGVDAIEDEIKFNGETYTRIDENNHMDQPYAIRVQVGKELTGEEAEKVSQLFGYDYAKTGGERGNSFEQDSPNSIIVYADTTKGRAYQHLGEFMEELPNTLENGTPVRKTDRAGAGTKGTRLVDGMGDVGYIEFYADNTFSFDK